MTQSIYAHHLADHEDRIDPWSDGGKKRHLDVEVTKFTLADFPLTDKEREEMASESLGWLSSRFVESLFWADVAECLVQEWREARQDDVALVAGFLNDPQLATIGNPRDGTWAVSLDTRDLSEGLKLQRTLGGLGVEAELYESTGERGTASVAVHDVENQRRLFDVLEDSLRDGQRELLDELVRARGPIPPELLERIHRADKLGCSPEEIAEQLDRDGYIDGMDDKHWTSGKVKGALG